MSNAPIKLLRLAPPGTEMEVRDNGERILRSGQEIGPYPNSVGAWLIEWAEKTPDIVFMADRTGESGGWRKLSYREFLNDICSIAQSLLDRGLSADRPIAILSDNSIDHALLTFAAMHVGIPAVPISQAYSLMSQDFGKLKYIAGLIRPGLVYASDGDKFAKALGAVDFGDAEILVSGNPSPGQSEMAELLKASASHAVDDAYARLTPDTVAKILFTSGSTGQPKGVLNTQRMLCSNQQAMAQLWPFIEDRPPIKVDWLPWNHTFGGNYVVNMVLRNGGTLYIDGGKPAPGLIEQTVENLKDVSPTIYNNVPRGFDMLLPFLEADDELRDNFFAKLDLIFYAAAGLTQSAWERLEALSVASRGERVMMMSGWGATETAPDCTLVHWPIEKSGVIGSPIPGTELKLVPNEGKEEVRVRGPNVTPGYFRDDTLTKEAFDEEGFYMIGDAVRLEDERDAGKGVVFDGRVSENFKLSSGTWVFVGGIRLGVVTAAADIVQDAAITGHDRSDLGILAFPNVSGCRVLCPDLPPDAPLDDLLGRPEVRAALVSKLQAYNADNPGSSTRISRALFLTEPPNIDANEITDKGYLNQRAVLANRAAELDRLYAGGSDVILVD